MKDTMFTGIYTGKEKHLFNKKALLRLDPDDKEMYLCQFDNSTFQESHGWHKFLIKDFCNLYELGRGLL